MNEMFCNVFKRKNWLNMFGGDDVINGQTRRLVGL